jgi:hypothetical protein
MQVLHEKGTHRRAAGGKRPALNDELSKEAGELSGLKLLVYEALSY